MEMRLLLQCYTVAVLVRRCCSSTLCAVVNVVTTLSHRCASLRCVLPPRCSSSPVQQSYPWLFLLPQTTFLRGMEDSQGGLDVSRGDVELAACKTLEISSRGRQTIEAAHQR